MRKAEIDQITSAVMEGVRAELQPVRDMALRHEQTLHGTDNNPETGMVHEVGAMKNKIWKVTAITNFLSGIIGAAIGHYTKP